MITSSSFLLSAFCLGPVALGAATVPPYLDKGGLADALAQAEGRVADLDVHLAVEYFDAGPDGALAVSPHWSRIRWAFKAPYGAKLYQEEVASKPWIGGVQDVAFFRTITAFDGTLSRQMSWFGYKEEELASAQPTGLIRAGVDPVLKVAAVEGYRLMTLWRHGVPLSHVISANERVLVDAIDDAQLGKTLCRVQIPEGATTEAGKVAGPEVIFLDPARGYSIVRIELPTGREAPALNAAFDHIELLEVATGVWVPAEGWYYIYGREGVVRAMHYTVTNAAANSGLEDAMFAVSFPATTTVLDMRSGQSFIVGYTPDEMDSMVRAQAETARRAVASLAQGRTPEIPIVETVPAGEAAKWGDESAPSAFPRRSWLAACALGIGALCVLGVAFAGGPRRSRLTKARRTGGALVGAIMLLCAVATLARATLGTSDSQPRGDSPWPRYDCGVTVLCFLGHFYETGWTAERVFASTGSQGGLSLLQMRDTLRAMGLGAEGLQVGSVAELRRLSSATPGSGVVLATTSPGPAPMGHFLCLVGSSPTHFVLVDPPRPVRAVSDAGVAELLRRGRGYCVFVRTYAPTP